MKSPQRFNRLLALIDIDRQQQPDREQPGECLAAPDDGPGQPGRAAPAQQAHQQQKQAVILDVIAGGQGGRPSC